jgi:hypothetical protein
MQTAGGFQTNAGENGIFQKLIVAPLLGAIAAVMAAVASTGNYLVFKRGTHIWSAPGGVAKRVTATAGGTAADIKAIGVTITGTDAADAPLTETLPVFTVNTPGTVTSVGAFKTIDTIVIPAHDGTGATTSVGEYQGAVDAVLAAFTDKGVQTAINKAVITNPDVPRNITATAGGTNTDIKAVQPIVRGTNENGAAISETLPAFTVDTAGSVVGNKAFKTVDWVEIPPHDGNGATVSFGTGAKLGLGAKLSRSSVLMSFLNGVREAALPTVAISATVIESNTAQLGSALNGTDVMIYFIEG